MSRCRLDPWIRSLNWSRSHNNSRTISALFAAAGRCNPPPHRRCLQVELNPSRCIFLGLQLVAFPVTCTLPQMATTEIPKLFKRKSLLGVIEVWTLSVACAFALLSEGRLLE